MTEYDNTDPETFERSSPTFGDSLDEKARMLGKLGQSVANTATDAMNAMGDVAKQSAREESQRAMEEALVEAAESEEPTPERVVIDEDSILATPVEGEPFHRIYSEDVGKLKARVVTTVERLKREGAFVAYYNGEDTRIHVGIERWPSTPGNSHSYPVHTNSFIQNFEPYPVVTTEDTRFVACEYSATLRP